jgi:hypothetical protein
MLITQTPRALPPLPPAPPPGSPTPAERRHEVAHLLAIAYWRLRMAATDKTDADDSPRPLT